MDVMPGSQPSQGRGRARLIQNRLEKISKEKLTSDELLVLDDDIDTALEEQLSSLDDMETSDRQNMEKFPVKSISRNIEFKHTD
ncbi:hypothetical protein KUTeg_004238 [Tegillarca granosa]|uniref:Uncharacterized protein n=1 Tax=Tegillarca granosa TaxID=220873 RepID=A0ABQ9FPD4_TEGGR|nr:hypothetical protein KUTeg_004238 [Tegillarca granosa]